MKRTINVTVRIDLLRCPLCGGTGVNRGPRRPLIGESLLQYCSCKTCTGRDGNPFKFRVEHRDKS